AQTLSRDRDRSRPHHRAASSPAAFLAEREGGQTILGDSSRFWSTTMRHAPVGGILVLIFLVPHLSAGERYVVKQNLTEVRAEAGDRPENYVTNRLNKGDVVEVVKVGTDGWLQIKPPPGSVSWINTRFLWENAPKNTIEVVAFEDGAPV